MKREGYAMLQTRRTLLGLCVAMSFAVCASGQTTHYSVLCNLTQTSKETAATKRFDVAVPGHKVSAVVASVTEGPRRIIVLQDISGSMGQHNAQRISLEAVKDVVESSPPTDQLALVDFNADTYIDIDMSNVDLFSKALSDPNLGAKIKPKGRTALFDSVAKSAAYLEKSPHEGDSILVISDGDDNASKLNAEKLRERLLASKIRLYVLMLTGHSQFLMEQNSRSEFLHLVVDTGGAFLGADPLNKLLLNHGGSGQVIPVYDASPTALATIRQNVEELHKLIEKGYKMEFDLDAPLTKSTKLNVSALDQHGKPVEGLQLFCPKYINEN
ncbi:MAG TPA: vWA domain-containing protein [Terriglobales bacterium]|jgi:hypothetical protein|nr:vWA domain-containing protein [Terriglobales bacterium]